jgi:putative ABC transport system permease protein
MNVVSRGIKNAFRSPMRSGAIILMLAISICLILSMLVARSSVNAKINQVKSTAGTNITISPAGVFGFAGGGNNLTSAQLTQITKTAHITSTTATLSDQLASTDTNLTPSLTLGNFGARQARFDSSSSSSTSGSTSVAADTSRPAPTPHTTVTGTTNPNSVSTNGSNLSITSGKTIDGNSTGYVALLGKDLASKNNLSVGKTFTAYGKTFTVTGIYTTGNTFQDSGIIMPLATVQTLSSQSGEVSSVVATVDSSDNVNATVTSLKSTLGSKADIVSQAQQASDSVSSLQSISGLALASVIGSAIAGAVIILLAMIMIVRERRREIGVIKAIGGTNRKVMAQFISEALTITVVGSIVGLTLGVLVSGPMTSSLVSSSQNSSSTTQSTSTRPSGGPGGFGGGFIRGGLNRVSSNLTQVTSSITPQVFALSLGITLLIAIIGSAVPAWFIARISPAEVLRTE